MINYKKAGFIEICRLWTDCRRYFGQTASIDQTELIFSRSGDGTRNESKRADPNASSPFRCCLEDSAVDEPMDDGDGGDVRFDGRTTYAANDSPLPNQKEAMAFILKQVSA